MCSWHELIFNKPLISQISNGFLSLKNQASSSKEFLIDPGIWTYCSIFNIIHNKKEGKSLVSHTVDFFFPFIHLWDCKTCIARGAYSFKMWCSLGYYIVCSNFLAEISKIANFIYLSTCHNICVVPKHWVTLQFVDELLWKFLHWCFKELSCRTDMVRAWEFYLEIENLPW